MLPPWEDFLVSGDILVLFGVMILGVGGVFIDHWLERRKEKYPAAEMKHLHLDCRVSR